jgi:hypothetical protein
VTDPPLERAALTPREFTAGALAVIGCFVLAETTAQLVWFVAIAGFDHVDADLLLPFALVTALALFFVLCRNRLASRLTAKDAANGWHLDWRKLQRAAIQVMGVCFMASGLRGLQFLGPEQSSQLHSHSIPLLSFLQIEPASVATFAIGTILTLTACSIHRWIERDRGRNAAGAEAR